MADIEEPKRMAVLVTDRSGNTLFFSPDCTVEKVKDPPPRTLASVTVADLGKYVRILRYGGIEGHLEHVRWGIDIWRWAKFDSHPTEVMLALDTPIEVSP